MSFLIDTCCISELVKKKPDDNVLEWFAITDEMDLFLSVITIGELVKELKNCLYQRENRILKSGFMRI